MTSATANDKVELLAPAGNMEKLEIALHYGADAVYLSGKDFSLRNFSGNFTLEEMRTAIDLAHARGAKVYVAINIFARNEELQRIQRYLHELKAITPDGIIAADPAVIDLAHRIAPSIPIHLSTQANTTNVAAARFWQQSGVQRINVARELTMAEIGAIARSCSLQIEAFVHGAMCISYSGRCLLSNFMARRPANQGMCCQPCRFQYTVMEETRPGQFFPVAEDERGTYLFNSRDLCMLDHIPALIKNGIHAFKIEGRMKSIHYAATTIKTYREAIDRYYEAPERYDILPYWRKEVSKIANRDYCTGFYFDDPTQTLPLYHSLEPSHFPMIAKVLSTTGPTHVYVDVRNQIRTGDTIEIVRPKGPPVEDTILEVIDENGKKVDVAHPGTRATLGLRTDCQPLDLMRRMVCANH